MKKLSQLETPSFEEIFGLQQQTAQKLLIEHGVLPRIKAKKTISFAGDVDKPWKNKVMVSDVGPGEIVASGDASKIRTLC